jgi:8-oxo-dGTP pyrophosphatase MutT (NUDIX family)
MRNERSAKVLIFDRNDRVLVLRRSNTHPWHPLNPDLPGGIIESDETFNVGIIREVFEETGLRIAAEQLVELYRVQDIHYQNITMERVIYGVIIDISAPEITLSWEHDTFSWIEFADLEGIETANQKGIDEIRSKGLWHQIRSS